MSISDTDHAYQLGYAKGLKESRHTLAQAIAAEMNKVREETKKDIEDVIHHEIMEISDRVLSVGVSKPDANQVGMILFTDLGVKLIRKLHALQDKEKYD